MGWLFFGNRSNSPRNPGPLSKRQKPRLQLEHLEERIVLDNHFFVPDGPLIDIQLNGISAIAEAHVPAVQADLSGIIIQMANNKINATISSVVDDEVVISANAAGTPMSAVVAVSRINTNGFGTGSAVEQGPDQTSAFRLQAQENASHSSSIGVFVLPPRDASSAPVVSFESSGGNEGSLAGIDFQGFISPVAATSGSFVGSVVPTGRSIISAQPSHFANGVTSRIVAFERNKNLDVMHSLASNAAWVDSIFDDLFRRASNSTNLMDAGSWVNSLSIAHMTATEVAKDFLHSGEGTGELVAQVIQGQNKPFRTIKEKRRQRQSPGTKSIPNEEGT